MEASAPSEVVSKEKEEEEEDGGNGFPSFSDLGVPDSTTRYDVSCFLSYMLLLFISNIVHHS